MLTVAALGAALPALLAGCTGSPPAAIGAASTTGSPLPSASTSSTPVKQLRLVVKGSAVSGDTGTVDVPLGKLIRITVTSDVADEVHVHGADVGKDVVAGGTVDVDVIEKAPGRFEVELEKRKLLLTRLQVS